MNGMDFALDLCVRKAPRFQRPNSAGKILTSASVPTVSTVTQTATIASRRKGTPAHAAPLMSSGRKPPHHETGGSGTTDNLTPSAPSTALMVS